MSPSRRDADYLEDMTEAIRRMLVYTADYSYVQFLNDLKTQDAVIRNLQVLGEGAKRLSPQFKKAHPQIPWREIAGTRDKIVHEYFGINYDIVWTIVSQELTSLLSQIEAIR